MRKQKNNKKNNIVGLAIIAIYLAFLIHPTVGILIIAGLIFLSIKKPKEFLSQISGYYLQTGTDSDNSDQVTHVANLTDIKSLLLENSSTKSATPAINYPIHSFNVKSEKPRLEKRKRYLQVALNSTLEEARQIIREIPLSDRILIEAGTPLIKEYGADAVSQIKRMAPPGSYIVADNKCADLGSREVEMMANAGANASTCLGVAPVETIDSFIEECENNGIDSMIDMMNVDSPLLVLKKLKKLPDVVVLHRGVDESEFSREKQIPYYQIKQIKGSFDILVSVAGGDTLKEVQRATFNDADIVVIWKSVYEASENTPNLIKDFLKEVK